MSSKSTLDIAVVGAGGIANNIHLPALKRIDNIRVTAICDIVREKAEQTAARYNIPAVYTAYAEMISQEKPDGVFVLAEPDQLFRIALLCLDAGVDVFIEKPAGISLYQARTLQRKAEDKNRILQVGLNRRYIPLVQKVLRIMQDTTEITQVEGCFFKNGTAAFYGGCASAFVCDTIHAIDLMQWIAGGQAKKAAMIESRVNSEVPNIWNSIIKFDNGVTGIIKANYQTGGRVHTFEIHGPAASAYINLGFGEIACAADIIYFGGQESISVSSKGAGNCRIEHIDGIALSGHDEYYMYYGYYQENLEFIQCIKSRVQPLTNISEAVKTMALVEMLSNSLI